MRKLRPNPNRVLLLGVFSLAAGACGDAGEPPSEAPLAKSTQAIGEVGDPTCVPGGTRYFPGRKLFVDRTEEWGLEGLKVTGTRLSVADVNGDNYPDLVVRSRTDAETSFDSGKRPVWVLKNTRNGTFEDITRSSGLIVGRLRGANDAVRNARASQVVAFADVDNDGDLDAFSGSPPYRPAGVAGRERSELMLNSGYGTFTLRAAQLPELHPAGATFLDQDKDGFIDLFVPAFQRVTGGAADVSGSFFRGTGDRRTTLTVDSAAAAGLRTPGAYYRSSIACDLNHDGSLELMAAAVGRRPNALFQGRATDFVERGQASGFAQDTNVDWKDNLYARAHCSIVREAGGPPEELGACTGVPDHPAELRTRRDTDAARWQRARDTLPENLGGNTFTTLCADFDGDGELELYNAEERSAAEGQSADPAQVLRVTSATGEDIVLSRPGRAATNLELSHANDFEWTEGIQTAAVFDADNDGRPDLYIGGADHDYASSVGHLYQNVSAGSAIQFLEVPAADGLSQRRAQGIAVADFDRDGDLDLVVGHSRFGCGGGPIGPGPVPIPQCEPTEQVRFYENVYGSGGNWVQLKLVGNNGSNGAAIGARVTVELSSGRKLVQEVDGGHGYFGAQQDHVLHFGLGSDCTAQVTVEWPDKGPLALPFAVSARHHYRVTRATGTPRELPLKGFCANDVSRMTGAVGPAELNDYYDVFCVQDRLSELGYAGITRELAASPGRVTDSRNQRYATVPQRLSVNGVWSDDTLWAIRTFQTTILNSDVQAGMSGIVTPTAGVTGYTSFEWLGASNAPRWRESEQNGPGWQNDDRDNHDHGASWAFEAVALAGAALPSGTIRTNDVSLPNGGDTRDHGSHEGGLDIDVRLTANGGRWYNTDTATAALESQEGTLWRSCPGPVLTNSDGENLTGDNYVDRALVWLWESPSEACRAAVVASSTATPRTFEDGYARLVPPRPDYDRAAIQLQIRTFLDLRYPDGSERVPRVIFMDPVLVSNLVAAGIARTRLRTTTLGHADHYHVDVAPPPRIPQ